MHTRKYELVMCECVKCAQRVYAELGMEYCNSSSSSAMEYVFV